MHNFRVTKFNCMVHGLISPASACMFEEVSAECSIFGVQISVDLDIAHLCSALEQV